MQGRNLSAVSGQRQSYRMTPAKQKGHQWALHTYSSCSKNKTLRFVGRDDLLCCLKEIRKCRGMSAGLGGSPLAADTAMSLQVRPVATLKIIPAFPALPSCWEDQRGKGCETYFEKNVKRT